MFETIALRASAVDACTAALRDAILEGRAAVGSRLPPERDLAEQFGVNRVTVRSALGRLATAGLVAVRQGSGYVVRDYRAVGGPDLVTALSALARRRGELSPIARDLLFVRSCLAEGVLTRLAANPPPRSARTVISHAIDAMEEAIERGAGVAEIGEADMHVLGAVLDATRSDVLRLFLNPVATILREVPELGAALYVSPRENVAAFRALLAWLEHPDPSLIEPIISSMRARDEDALARLVKQERATGTSMKAKSVTARRRS